MASTTSPVTGGHLFIIDGDVKSLACDAWLLPTDGRFSITASFYEALGMSGPGPFMPAIERGGFGGRSCICWRESPDEHVPDLWLGDVGRSDAEFSHYTGVARDFIDGACARLEGRVTDRPPLIALNVLGSGRGGKRSARGALLRELIPALLDAARSRSCDVVLVTYGSVMYSAAQKVRRELATGDPRYWEALPEGLRPAAKELAECARSGGLVTFFGAGVGVEAGMPTWKQLLKDVASSLTNFDVDSLESLSLLDPRDQATVLRGIGANEFDEAVRRALAMERYSLTHGLLSSLPVNEAVTTNFDTLYERAAVTAGRQLAVLPGDRVGNGSRWLLKLHGTLGKDLVLTRDEYLGAMSHHTALRGLVQAMLLTRQMLFVGYSLRDEDFHQLVHEVRAAFDATDDFRMGTVLLLDPIPHFDELWPELQVISMSQHEPVLVRDDDKARRLRILLDLVGSLAASAVGFVADDSIGELRTEDEIRLAGVVAELRALYEIVKDQGEEWKAVKDFVDKFKADPY